MSSRLSVALTILFSLSAGVPLLAQIPASPDSVASDSAGPVELKEITITVTRQQEPLSRVPMAVDVLGRDAIRKGQLTMGLDEALNDLPGVFVANRYNFNLDQRLSIRGFGSRANFGTRGVKVLLDGVPQTLPDGQSQLTNVDFGSIDRIEVLRGSASSLYGNASGGVISLQTEAAGTDPFAAWIRSEWGSYGLAKYQLRASSRAGRASGTVSLSRTTYDGFRQWSKGEVNLLTLGGDYAASATKTLRLRFSAANNPTAQNPGALTFAEYAVNPDSANGTNILRGVDKAVKQQQLSLSFIRHDDGQGTDYSLTTFGLLRNIDNPLATPSPILPGPNVAIYSTIDRRVGGVRTQASHRLGAAAAAPRLMLGFDLQGSSDERREVRSVDGLPTDSVLRDQRERASEFGPFLQLHWSPVPRATFSAGGRYDRIVFSVLDHFLGDSVDNSGSRTMSQWNGNVGASWFISDAVVPYVNFSTSFDTPTTTELAGLPPGEGGFNDSLGPQRARTYEIGARGRVGRSIEWSASGFLTRVTNAIVQYAETQGRALYANAGSTHNNGVELGLSVKPTRGVRLFGAYTYADYTFAEYTAVVAGTVTVLDGKRLPGVPKHFARLGLRTEPGYGFVLDVDHTISSSVFANDPNTVTVDGWGAGITNIRIGWDGRVGRTSLNPFLGVLNLSDRKYIGSVTINGTTPPPARLPRVLEPAPGRNVYAGMEVGWGR